MQLLLNSDTEELIYGLVYMILAAPQTPLYVVTMMAVSAKNRQDKNFTYQLVNFINFTQIAQSLVQLMTSPILIVPQLYDVSHVISRLLGCSMITFYQAELPTMAILAVCRILLFQNCITPTKVPIGVKVFFFLGSCYLLFFYAVGVITSNWVFKSPLWDFDHSVPYADFFGATVFYMSILCMFVSYVCYITIAVLIYVRKKGSMSASSRKDEMAILSQYTFITVYTTVCLCFWNKANDWFGVQMGSKGARAAMNIGWISGIYMNPVLLLLLNKPVRIEFLQILGFSKRNLANVQTIPSTISKSEHMF